MDTPTDLEMALTRVHEARLILEGLVADVWVAKAAWQQAWDDYTTLRDHPTMKRGS